MAGEQSAEERGVRVQELSEKEYPVLVATGCRSEGINLLTSGATYAIFCNREVVIGVIHF